MIEIDIVKKALRNNFSKFDNFQNHDALSVKATINVAVNVDVKVDEIYDIVINMI